MEPGSRIYVAGHRGLAGSALVRRLQAGGFRNLVTRSHAELELTGQAAVRGFFERERPEYVFLAAAKVGGIVANNTYPAEFIHSNLSIQTNAIHEAWRAGVRRLLFLGSSCIYPRDCPQPMKEEYLLRPGMGGQGAPARRTGHARLLHHQTPARQVRTRPEAICRRHHRRVADPRGAEHGQDRRGHPVAQAQEQ